MNDTWPEKFNKYTIYSSLPIDEVELSRAVADLSGSQLSTVVTHEPVHLDSFQPHAFRNEHSQ